MRRNLPVPVSLTPEMLRAVNDRADSLGLTRSAYVQQLLRKDLGLTSTALPPPSATPPARPAKRAPVAKKRAKKKS